MIFDVQNRDHSSWTWNHLLPILGWVGAVMLSLPCALAEDIPEPDWSRVFETPPSTERPRARSSTVARTPPAIQIASPEELVELSQWVRWLALLNLPDNIENDRHWGKQKRVFDGLHMHLEGLRLDTKRKWKMVNHGTWSRYFIEFVDPDERMDISVTRLETASHGRSFSATTRVVTPLRFSGRVSQHQLGVQLMSVSAEADATVAMEMDLECEIRIQPLVFPPEVELRPSVTRAQVELREFEVHRISRLHGDAAELLGRGIEKMLDRKLEQANDRLVEKINASLSKQQDKLKFSAQDWFTGTIKKD